MSYGTLVPGNEVVIRQFGTRHGNTRVGVVKAMEGKTVIVTMAGKELRFDNVSGNEVDSDPKAKEGFRLLGRYLDPAED